MAFARARRVRTLVLLATLLLSIAGATRARADIGVAIDIGKIAVSERLAKGGSYQLPVIGVRNPGNEPSTYEMGVSFVQGQPARQTPGGWLTFAPQRFTLQPGATQPVRITLDIPTNADPDDYAALLHVQAAAAGEGARVGAAAASQLSFTVKPSTLLEAWLLRGRTAVERTAPWSYLLTLLLIVASAGSWLRHRFRVAFRVERRQ